MDEQTANKFIEATHYPRMAATAALALGALFLGILALSALKEYRYIGAGVSAVLFEGAKWGLGFYLRYFTVRYESLYGTLAVLPLFLLSIYLWWVILLIGAELCRALQRLPLLRQMVADKKRAGEHSIIHSTEMPTKAFA